VTSLEKALRDFAEFAAKLKGDEKSEAQTFLFHLLAAFGHGRQGGLETAGFVGAGLDTACFCRAHAARTIPGHEQPLKLTRHK
jgi:hypothetical protein